MIAWLAAYDVGHASAIQLDDGGGAAFSPVAHAGEGGYSPLDCWYLDNPPAGSHTVFVSGGYPHGMCLLQSWSNVDLTNPPLADGFLHSDVGGASLTTAIGAGGGTVVHAGSFYGYDGVATVGDMGTAAGEIQNPGGDFGHIMSFYKPGASSVAWSYTGDGDGSTVGAILLMPMVSVPGGGSLIGGALGKGSLIGGALVQRRKSPWYHKHSSGLFLSDRSLHVSR